MQLLTCKQRKNANTLTGYLSVSSDNVKFMGFHV